MKKPDIISGAALIILAVAAYIATYYFPVASTWGLSGGHPPYSATAATWPRIVLIILIVLDVFLIIASVVGRPGMATTSVVQAIACEVKEGERAAPKDIKSAIVFAILMLAYIFLLQPLGFPIDTTLFGICCVFVLGQRGVGHWKGVLIAVVVSALVIIVFSRLLYLPLPRGEGIARVVTDYLIFAK